MEIQLFQRLESISNSIQDAGFDPHDQITGYLRTGNDRYITRNGNARELIKTIDRRILKDYCMYLKTKK